MPRINADLYTRTPELLQRDGRLGDKVHAGAVKSLTVDSAHRASVQFADESRRRAAGRLSVVPAVTDTEAGWAAASAPARPG